MGLFSDAIRNQNLQVSHIHASTTSVSGLYSTTSYTFWACAGSNPAASGAIRNISVSNNIVTLDVSGLTALNQLICVDDTRLTSNVSGLAALTYLDCDSNNLSGTLNVGGCTALPTSTATPTICLRSPVSAGSPPCSLHCDTNHLSGTLDVSNNPLVNGLWSFGNTTLTSVNVTGDHSLPAPDYNTKLVQQILRSTRPHSSSAPTANPPISPSRSHLDRQKTRRTSRTSGGFVLILLSNVRSA